MKKLLVLGLLANLVSFASAADVNYNWKKYGGSYDGLFTDVNHWQSGSVTPTATCPGQWEATESHFGDVALFDFRGNNDDGLAPNIYYPDGVLTNLAGMTPRTTKKVALSLYGTNTTLCLPRPTLGGSWGLNAMRFIAGATSSSLLLSFDGDRGNTTLKDFTMRVRNDSDTERKLVLESGVYDFCRDLNTTLWFFQQSVSEDEKDAVVEIASSSVVTAGCWSVAVNCPSRRNTVRIAGKASFGSSVNLPIKLQNICVNSAVERYAGIEVVEGGELEFASVNDAAFGLKFGLAYDAKYPKYGSSTSCVFRVSADAGTLRQPASSPTIESVGPGRHQLMLVNGSTGSFAGSVSLGCAAGATGEVAVVNSTAAFGNAFALGGNSAANVAAGAAGFFAATNATVSFGSSFCLYNGGVSLGENARIVLEGNAALVGAATYGGTRAFAADGATLVGDTATTLVSGFDTATIGAKGLGLVAPDDLTVAQAFTSAAGETGELVLSSGGLTTLTVDVPLPVVATNVAALTLGGHAVGGLMLGAAGSVTTLSLVAGEVAEIGGDLVLAGVLNVALTGSWPVGTKAQLKVSGDFSAASRAVWSKAVVVSGLAAGTTWTTAAESSAGVWTLTLEAVADTPIVVSQPSGSETHATNISYGVGLTLEASVAKDAKATFAGDLGSGGFAKTGGGAVELSGCNEFLRGLTLGGGLLSATTLEALGLCAGRPGLTLADGTLWLKAGGVLPTAPTVDAANGANAMVVVKNDADVTMPIPTAVRGSFTKRGKGRLTLEVADDTDWTGLKGNGMASINAESVTWDDVNGTVPTTANHYAGVNVGEGELVIRGVGAEKPTVSQDSGAGLDVGLAGEPHAADFAQPGLVLDNVDYRLTSSTGASGMDFAMGVKLAPDTSGITTPYLVISNGAVLTSKTFAPCWRSTDKASANVLLDNGTIVNTFQFIATASYCPQASGGESVTNVYTLRNGSAIYSGYKDGRFYVNGWAIRMDFDNSRLALNAAGTPLEMYLWTDTRYPTSASLTLRNGSYLGAGQIGADSESSVQTGSYPNNPINLTFDDSEWFVGAGDRDIPSSNMNVTVTSTGGGLRFNPPADSRWRLYTRVVGDAGLVKGGAGTLFVDDQFKYHAYQADPVTLAGTGTNVVTGGVLEMKPTAVGGSRTFGFAGEGGTIRLVGTNPVLTNATVCGTGTLGSGTFLNLTVGAKAFADGTFDVLTIDGANGAELAGRTVFDFGCDAEHPSPLVTKPAVIARWTGTKPDVSTWRSRNIGVPGRRVVFAAQDDGTVTGVMKLQGLIVIVR